MHLFSKHLRLTPPLLRHCLPLLAAGALWLAPPAHAQTSTLVYGSDTDYVSDYNPPMHYFGNTTPITGGEVELGAPGQFVTSYAAAYAPDAVDVSQGFVARVALEGNGANGEAIVIKNPNSTDYLRVPPTPAGAVYPPEPPAGSVYGLGAISFDASTQTATGLKNTLDIAFITYKQSASNNNDRHYKEVQVFTTDANGVPATLADVTGLDISSQPTAPGSNTLQVRYIPRFGTLDVYLGPKLITRVANVDLSALQVSAGGKAQIGVTSGNPALSGNTEFFPAYLQHFSIGNQLTFGTGFGPNYYEDRFPFAATGQSVFGTGSDTAEYTDFWGAKSGGTLNSKHGTLDASPVFTLDASASVSYNVGIGVDATATGGTADITYPLFLDMLFPAQYSVAPSSTFTLPMSFYPDLTSASLKTTSPSANFTADLECKTNFAVNLDASVFGQSLTSGQLFGGGINIPNTKFFDVQEILASGLVPDVNGGVNYSGYFQGNGGTKNGYNVNKPGDGTPGKGSSDGAEAGDLLTKYVTFGITIPDLSTSGGAAGFGTNPNDLTSSASSPFISLSSDFTNAVLSEIPGLDILTQIPFFNNDYTLNLGSDTVELGTHFCDIYGSVSLGADVNYDFTPGPQVYLDLSPEDPNFPNPLGPFALDPATGKLVSPPVLTMPSDGSPLTVTPYVVLDRSSTFQTKDDFNIGGSLSINPLSFSFGYNDDTFSTDPSFGFPLTVAGSIPVYHVPTIKFPAGTSSGGAANAVPFQSEITGKSFTLFPTVSDSPAIDSVTPAFSLTQPAGSSATLPIQLATEHTSFYGSVVWDYDGVPSDPQTTLPNWVRLSEAVTTAAVPYSLLTAQGLHTITLLNQDSGSTLFYPSNLFTFTVSAPVPVLNGIDTGAPVTAGSAGFTIRATGSRFSPPVAAAGSRAGYPGSVVLWNGKPLVTRFISSQSLTAAVPASLLAAAGTAQITVYTSGPGGGTSTPRPVPILNVRPTLSSLSQTQIGPGLTSFPLTLTGQNFVAGAVVLLGNGTAKSTRQTTFVSSTTLKLVLTASDLSAPGTFTVQVQNPSPGGGLTQTLSYTIGQAPATGAGVYFVPNIIRTANGYEAHLTVFNTSQTGSADSVLVLSETVGGDSTGRNGIYPSLPNPRKAIFVGTVPAGGSVTPAQIDTFPLTLGASGKIVLLTVQGSAGGRAFTSRLRVTLP